MTIPSLDRLGIPGVVGFGLLLFCLSFYLGNIAPTQGELAELKQERAQWLTAAAQTGGASRADSEKRSALGESLPPLEAFPQILQELNSLAGKHGVTIDSASYTLVDGAGQRRMEVTLPFKTHYPSLRAYLRDIFLLKSAPSLEELTLKRQQASDPFIEATVRLSCYFAPAPCFNPQSTSSIDCKPADGVRSTD